jgi:hypothetical protein
MLKNFKRILVLFNVCMCLFINYLFSNSYFVTSNGTIGTDMGGNDRYLILGVVPTFLWRDFGKPRISCHDSRTSRMGRTEQAGLEVTL